MTLKLSLQSEQVDNIFYRPPGSGLEPMLLKSLETTAASHGYLCGEHLRPGDLQVKPLDPPTYWDGHPDEWTDYQAVKKINEGGPGTKDWWSFKLFGF